jgi:hypothetical protein
MQETSQAETETQLWLAEYSSQQYSQLFTTLTNFDQGARAKQREIGNANH